MNFYFFRHGETEWNRQRRFQGSTDIPLNETGREQAQQLKIKLRDFDFDHILSSDLTRAKEACEIALGHRQLPTDFHAALQEAHLGEVEGIYRHEFDERYSPEMWSIWKSLEEKYLDYSFPGGESPRQHLSRVKDFLEAWAAQMPIETNVAVSTHGGVIWRMVHFADPTPEVPPTIPNCGVFLLSYDSGTWRFRGEI